MVDGAGPWYGYFVFLVGESEMFRYRRELGCVRCLRFLISDF